MQCEVSQQLLDARLIETWDGQVVPAQVEGSQQLEMKLRVWHSSESTRRAGVQRGRTGPSYYRTEAPG